MIFSQYTETCEVIIDDPKIGWDDIEYYEKKAIRNISHAKNWCTHHKIDCWVPNDWNKVHQKLQSHCANMTFSEKVDMTGIFNSSHIKGGDLQWNIYKNLNAHDLTISVGNYYSEDQLIHTFLDHFHQGGKYSA